MKQFKFLGKLTSEPTRRDEGVTTDGLRAEWLILQKEKNRFRGDELSGVAADIIIR